MQLTLELGGRPEVTVEQVLAALRGLRAPLITEETDLHGLVARHLTKAGIPYRREVQLGPRERIDFLAGTIGVECKKGQPNGPRLMAQVERYCRSPVVQALIVVTPWGRHLSVPALVAGKPVHVVSLNRLWRVAL